jgi:C4-dicarboxylate transporter, DctM subunit
MITILVILLAIAFFSGAELFAVMLGACAIGALTSVKDFWPEFNGMVATVFGAGTGEHAKVLSTIPMFIYAGYVLAEAKTADRLVRVANAALGWMPGGLAVVTILTCALFTTFTGASGVTIVALGGVLMPALVKNGYPKRFSMGLLAGTGSVGLMFPPALPLFIYGTVYGAVAALNDLNPENWDTRRFLLAGIVPGIVLIALLSLVAVVVAWKLPRQKFDFKELVKSFTAALPELIIPFAVIGGLAAGFGLEEIAALTVVYVVVLEVGVLRMLSPKGLWTISREAMAMVGAIFVIILISSALTNYMVTAEVPKKLVAWTQDHVESKILFLLALNVLLLFVGMVMDIFSAIVIIVPLIGPIAATYGIDPYHLGVIFLINLEVGYLTPPVGLNLFITSVKFQTPVVDVMKATIPFLITMVVALMIVTYVPALTIVPEAERTMPMSTLVGIVQIGAEEAKVTEKEITLVDATGKPLLQQGKPVVRKFLDCKSIEDDTQRNVCQTLFFDVTDCMTKPDTAEPERIICKHAAIAEWITSNLNDNPLDVENAIVVVEEVALVDGDGSPIKDDDDQPIVGPDGGPIVKKFATCAPLDGTARETCRLLFIKASSCHIKPHDCDDPEEAEACRKAAIDACVREAAAEWVEEFPDTAKRP